ncbi:MAG: pseudouridine synthase [Haloplasmataceae bacterium]|jgi:23S rRNA pseudouridine1911/1915/1917 synthase|nr:pseudouridine synthase [Haloplasmataceae bacterium]
METLIYIVQEEETSERLDKLVSTKFSDFSRNQIKKMMDEDLVFVNKKLEKASYKVKWGDVISVMVKDPEVAEIIPEDIPLDIYYEDEDVIVINKPSGMVVHPANGHYTGTLVNAVLAHSDDLSGINGVCRPGVVHRIDKDTSGLIIMAKNDQAHNSLAEQFKEKTTVREYFALCHGCINHLKGTVDAPIGRDPNERKKMAVVAGGRHAVTHFEVLEHLGEFTYVKCKLETGRTHQIRVHMSYIGFPLVGDDRYGPKKVIGDQGQFLHAAKLGFVHPKTNEYLEFTSPLPEYFEKFLNNLRKKYK